MRRKRKKKHVVLKTIGIILAFLIVACAVIVLNAIIPRNMGNPYSTLVPGVNMKKSVSSIERVDEAGTLYTMEYDGNYDSALVKLPIVKLGFLKETGCSAFFTYDEDGDALLFRNYDLAHTDDRGEITGLNVLVRCAPEGGYRSVCISDAMWFSMIGLNYKAGVLDDGKTNLTPLALIPYLCMDGMNEKGLTMSILSVDIKDGEEATNQQFPGRNTMVYPVFMRRALDTCASVDEAVKLAENTNFVNNFGYDYHVFMTDASGKSAVVECRYNEMKVTYTDAVTNCYVGFDDAEDCYWGDELKEKNPGKAETSRDYHMGYGHGYERLNQIILFLDEHLSEDGNTVKAGKRDALDTLKKVSQDYTGEMTSYTQYSVIYDSTNLTAEIYPNADLSRGFSFSVN